jgi:hypothetical protein
MLKKILIGVGILVLIVAAGYIFYLNDKSRTLSPPGKVELTSPDLSMVVDYSRPSVRGRVIFGTENTGALQPFGKYWRLGANEATEISFNRDVTFNGVAVKAGTYRAYAIPGSTEFEIILNSELGKWGAFEPDHDFDVYKTKVPVSKTQNFIEQYTIRIEQVEGGANIIFEWADVQFVVPVK